MDFCDKSAFERVKDYGHGDGSNGFRELCGIRITALSPDGGSGEMPLGPQHLNPNGTVHGGALYTLADTVAGHAAIAWGMAATGRGADSLACTTVTGSLNFLRPARGTKLVCLANCRKMGRTLAVLDVSILDDQGRETCSGGFTFCYVDRARYTKQDETSAPPD